MPTRSRASSPQADTPAALAQVAYRFGLRHLAAQDHPAALRAFESAADNLRQASGEAPGGLMHDIAPGLGSESESDAVRRAFAKAPMTTAMGVVRWEPGQGVVESVRAVALDAPFG